MYVRGCVLVQKFMCVGNVCLGTAMALKHSPKVIEHFRRLKSLAEGYRAFPKVLRRFPKMLATARRRNACTTMATTFPHIDTTICYYRWW